MGGSRVVGELSAEARPLTGSRADYDALIALAREAHIVLLGEGTYGTHEFYRERARITQRLIDECGFDVVAIEGDCPDAHRVNRFISGESDDANAGDALGCFTAFPSWRWCNQDVRIFVEWLRAYNDSERRRASKVRFVGLDLYCSHAAMEALIAYLAVRDTRAAARARKLCGWLQPSVDDTAVRELDVLLGSGAVRREEVIDHLVLLLGGVGERLSQQRCAGEEDRLLEQQHAEALAGATSYYHTMFGEHVSSWNQHELHMADTLDRLLVPLSNDRAARIVVWAHNSHTGDARWCEMSGRGEHNLGQLLRERHHAGVLSVGFTTYAGAVTAASKWGGEAECKALPRALTGSYETLLHETSMPALMICPLAGAGEALMLLHPYCTRDIGVVCRPDDVRRSYWRVASAPRQYDALVHWDRSSAVQPLEPAPGWLLGKTIGDHLHGAYDPDADLACRQIGS